MRVSESWLREFVNPPVDAAQIGHLLTMAGLELDSMEPAAPEFKGVFTGKIDAIEQHPDADKLRVCQVNVGADDLLQIVCGAANAAQGLSVAVATVGAVLPGDFKIKKAKLRGAKSEGMLCSASELGLAEASDGIMELPADTEIGQDFREFLQLEDQILEIDLTPNRADCLCMTGIARELAILTDQPFANPVKEPVAAVSQDTFEVALKAPQACPSYFGRVIRNVNVNAESPLWLQERLRRAGLRSLTPVVDVTNLVLLELGQPMHAFDLNKLNGSVHVRYAEDGEKLVLLDGKEVTFDAETLVIADEKGAVAMAGVMGGEPSSVTSETRDIFFESAFFEPSVIAGKARSYGMHTDASHRYERGVDPRQQLRGIEYATQLVLDICGGEPGAVVERVEEAHMPARDEIVLRQDRIEKLLGITLEDAEVERILKGLGGEVKAQADGWRFVPPSYRFDLLREVDLIEELARVYGYDRIEPCTRTWAPSIERVPEDRTPVSRLKSGLNDLGYQEVITYSFVDPDVEKALNPDHNPMKLENPISSDLAVMRSSLWGGLLNSASHNLRRQQPNLRLFETGQVFINEGGELHQVQKLAGCITGKVNPEQWGHKDRSVDFFDLKGDIEALLQAVEQTGKVEWKQTSHPALHPGQAAELLVDGKSLGVLGQLHPQAQKSMGLGQTAYVFEFDLESLLLARVPTFKTLSKFPTVKRDIAIIVDETVSYSQIVACIDALGDKLISDLSVFDVYKGEGVTAGRKSIALSLILQDFSRTLSVDEVENTIALVLEKLEADIGATLRE